MDEVVVKDDSVGELGAAPTPSRKLAVEGEDLGRSRGGLSTKIHVAVDGRGLPMRILLTAGQAGDNPQLLPLLDGYPRYSQWSGPAAAAA